MGLFATHVTPIVMPAVARSPLIALPARLLPSPTVVVEIVTQHVPVSFMELPPPHLKLVGRAPTTATNARAPLIMNAQPVPLISSK